MKTNLLLLALLSALLLTTLPQVARAQVKIGSNPTTIGSGSNLEVEAVNGKKVIVNKADGSVVIETTPTSTSASDLLLGVDGTGKVVTVDRTTIISSASATGSVGVAPYLRAEGNTSSSTTNPINDLPATGLSTVYTNQITYSASNGNVTIPATGYYYYAATATGPTDLGSGATSNDVCIILKKVAPTSASIEGNCARSPRFGPTAVMTGFYKFNAGDVLRFSFTTASNVATTTNYFIKINLFKISD